MSDAPAATLTTKVNAADAAGSSAAIVQTIVPDAPTAGVVQLNDGPEVCVAETKVVFAGTVSVSVTFAAVAGPAFVTVTLYVAFDPAATAAEPLFVTATSALVATDAVVVELLFAALGSAVAEETVAVFDSEPVADGETLKTNANVAEAVVANVAMVQVIVPPAPTAGVVQLNVGPAVCVAETKVVFGGSTSVRTTLAASAGPAFMTETL